MPGPRQPKLHTSSNVILSRLLQEQLNKVPAAKLPNPAAPGPDDVDLAGLFLGPKAENADFLRNLINQAFDGHVEARRAYYPEDPIWITDEVKASKEYQTTITFLQQEFETLVKNLKGSIPYWSYRWQALMAWDLTMTGIAGYFATMLYNTNNIAAEASPVTTPFEMEVGDDLCRMLGFTIPEDNKGIRPWGHLTCDGTVANMESMWAARNLKYYGITVAEAIKNEPQLAKAKTLTIPLPSGGRETLIELDTWSLLNLKADDVLALPERLSRKCQLDLDTISALLDKYALQVVGLENFSRKYLADLEYLPIVAGPSTLHYSWPKAAALVGIGQGNLHYLPIDLEARLQIAGLEALLEDCVQRKRPLTMLIVVLGSTDESAVDPLAEVLELRETYRKRGLDFYIHVDAAWGGYFATILREAPGDTSDTPPGRQFTPVMVMSEYVTRQYEALGQVDSVTVDPHKAGMILYPAGGLCYRNSAMRNLVAFNAPEVYHGAVDPALGIYGIEGSKPGASASAVYLSHRVIPANRNGYGKILGKCLFNSKRLYSALVTLADETDPFIVTPIQRLPAERNGEGPAKIKAQLEFIRERIVPKTNDELLADPEAMALFRELGSDQIISAYSFNFKKNGVVNRDVTSYNNFTQKIFERFSLSPSRDDVLHTPLFLAMSSFDPDVYGPVFINTFKQRLGLEGGPDVPLNFFSSVTMDPWLTDTPEGSFIPTIVKILKQTIIELIREME